MEAVGVVMWTMKQVGLIGSVLVLTVVSNPGARAQNSVLPDRVSFISNDGHTTLVGYIFKPAGSHDSRAPAVVMMHGRAGASSSLANGNYNATTLSKRHQEWGRLGTQQGYVAVLVD